MEDGMKWYTTKLFYLVCLAVLMMVAGLTLALTGNITGKEALSFFAGPVGVLVGYVAGTSDAAVHR